MPKRKIIIVLGQRVAKDSPDIIVDIANGLPTDDITVNISEDTFNNEYVERDKDLENEAIEDVSAALDEVDKQPKTQTVFYDIIKHEENIDPEILASDAPFKEEVEIEYKKGKLKKFLEELSTQGIKATVTAIVKGLIGLLFK